MDKNRTIRAGGSIFGAAVVGTFVRQLIAGPSEKAKELFETLVDPQSIYVGLIVIGAGVFLFCSWPGLVWVYNFPRRRKKKRDLRQQELAQEEALQRHKQGNELRDLILRLLRVGVAPHLERLDTPEELGHHEGTQLGAEFAITLRRLGELGFARPEGVSGKDWLTMLNQVYRYNEQYGIVAARFVMAQLIEDHRTGTVRKISHEYRLK